MMHKCLHGPAPKVQREKKSKLRYTSRILRDSGIYQARSGAHRCRMEENWCLNWKRKGTDAGGRETTPKIESMCRGTVWRTRVE